eukprot:COSAG06_NODE_26_length_32102_cov_250.952911_13_plen_61_part_00
MSGTAVATEALALAAANSSPRPRDTSLTSNIVQLSLLFNRIFIPVDFYTSYKLHLLLIKL